MKPGFAAKYHPLTSRPFLNGDTYAEYAPCRQLFPYIACFWESDNRNGEHADQDVLVIPDTCADIIIELNHTTGAINSCFCGIADSPVLIKQKPSDQAVTTFAVRFHFWAVRLFLDIDVRELYNQVIDLEWIEPKAVREFETLLPMASTTERIGWMETFLLKRLMEPTAKDRCNANVYNSIDKILDASGNISIKKVCEYTSVCQRQMERLFLQNIGISIKRTADLVRYQNVWQDIVKQDRFQVQDAVRRYGYADQPHLLNEFRRFHGMTPQQAKLHALLNR